MKDEYKFLSFGVYIHILIIFCKKILILCVVDFYNILNVSGKKLKNNKTR